MIKWLAAVMFCTAAVYAIDRLCWLPYQCQIAQKRTEAVVVAIVNLPPMPRVVEAARSGAATMERCIQICPADVGMYMTLAADQQVMGNLQDAANTYVTALRYDRRPEIFLNLGRVQMQLSQRDAAVASLTQACLFNFNFINEISDMDTRAEVMNAVHTAQNAP